MLQRPVSIHCVRAYGDVMDTIKRLHTEKGIDNVPPSIIMHRYYFLPPPKSSGHEFMLEISYGGTDMMMTSYRKMKGGVGERFYFSFSKCINMRSDKTRDVIKMVPEVRSCRFWVHSITLNQDRLLLESDHITPKVCAKQVFSICKIAAESRGSTIPHIAAITHENAMRVFSF